MLQGCVGVVCAVLCCQCYAASAILMKVSPVVAVMIQPPSDGMCRCNGLPCFLWVCVRLDGCQ
jgi:hypothetical protein